VFKKLVLTICAEDNLVPRIRPEKITDFIKMNIKVVLTILFIILLGGCVPHFSEPKVAPIPVPDTFSAPAQAGAADEPWWRQWHSPELDGLMDTALRNNLTLAAAWARLAQAEQQAVGAGADLRPAVNGSAGYARTEQYQKGRANSGINDWSLGITVSYEVNLWQRVRAGERQAVLNAQASREDLDAAFISISGAIAETWVSLIAAQKELALLTEQQNLNAKILQLVLVRFQQAQASILDINQQKRNITSIDNAMAVPRAKINSLRHRLALLMGKAPQEPLAVSGDLPSLEDPLSGTTTIVCVSVPADLLIRRPDIRAALLRLKAAGWQNIQAQAELLPKLSLSATYRHSADELADIIDNWLLNLAANLTGPIYDGKRRSAEVGRTKAVMDERLADYKKVILTAFSEVEDALTAERQQREILRTIKRQIKLSEASSRDIERRYMGGLGDFLPALREQVGIFNWRQKEIQTEAALLIARIGLNKAMGGRFQGTDDRRQGIIND
jgi:NodT family efflux transporter outer membrane factor (OMF) lipoprotein